MWIILPMRCETKRETDKVQGFLYFVVIQTTLKCGPLKLNIKQGWMDEYEWTEEVKNKLFFGPLHRYDNKNKVCNFLKTVL